ncbi:hypothetical protein B0H13DRAFT_2365089 [Mycena leptocephala]|nr:hypothetical protein B0H13DRAFT_2365089 [Mycena leptocephala]
MSDAQRTSNPTAVRAVIDAEAEVDREILELFFAEIPSEGPVLVPEALRLNEPVQVCGACGIRGYMGLRATAASPRFIVCDECDLTGGKQCLRCCLEHHHSNPLHFVKEWNGRCWSQTNLGRLGFVYQLGHGGATCPLPGSRQ